MVPSALLAPALVCTAFDGLSLSCGVRLWRIRGSALQCAALYSSPYCNSCFQAKGHLSLELPPCWWHLRGDVENHTARL